jgi:hypothetical protein
MQATPHRLSGVSPEDWIAMHDAAMRYAAGIDTLDMDLFRSAFKEDVVMTYGEPWGPIEGIDALVGFIDPFHRRLDATQHSTTNFRVVEYQGDTAITRCAVDALLVLRGHPGGDWFRRDGHYIDRMERAPDGWRFAHRAFATVFDSGNLSIVEFDWEG